MKMNEILVAVIAVLAVACTAVCVLNADDSAADPSEGEVGYQFTADGMTYEITVAASPVFEVKLCGIESGMTACTVPATVECGGVTYDVTALGDNCFYSEDTLTSLTLSEGLKTIGHQAFSQCGVTELIIPASVESINASAFFNTSFDSISVADGNTKFCMENNTLFGLNDSSEKVTLYVVLDKFTDVENYSIPDTVTAICTGAFHNVKNLGEVTVRSTVTSIGEYAFWCSGVSIVTWKTTADVSSRCFYESDIISISFAQSGTIAEIHQRAFYNSDLESLTFVSGASVEKIGEDAIYGTKVTVLEFPDGLTTLDYSSLEYAKELRSVSLPATLSSIDRFVFANCDKLASINVADGNTAYVDVDNVVLYNIGMTELIRYASASTATSFELPNTVKTIREYAFSHAENLTSFTFETGSQLETIQQEGMQYCKNLTSLQLPSTLKSLGMDAFKGCTGISTIDLSSVTKLTQNAFQNCTGISSVTLSDELEEIPYLCFSGCTSLTSVVIPAKVAIIGSAAFAGCTSLTSVTIEDGSQLKKIDGSLGGAFAGCTSLTTVTFEGSSVLEDLGANAFNGCTSLLHVDIPSTVKYLRSSAFSKCSSLIEVVLPSSLVATEGHVLYGCFSLKFIVNNSELTEEKIINTMVNDSRLSPEVISGGTSKLVTKTFDGNMYIFAMLNDDEYYTLLGYSGTAGTVELPNDIDGISGYNVTGSAFKNLAGITAFHVSDDNTMLSVDDKGVLYSKDKTKLLAYPAGRTADTINVYIGSSYDKTYYAVDANTSVIGECAFYGSNLDIIYVPNESFTTDGLETRSLATMTTNWKTVYLEAPALASGTTLSSDIYNGYDRYDSCYVNTVKYRFELTVYQLTDSDPIVYRSTATANYSLGEDVTLGDNANLSYMYIDHWSAEMPEKATFSDVQSFSVYERAMYTVVFKANDGSGTMAEIIATYGLETELPECQFTRNHYDFAGWSTTSSGVAVYDDKGTYVLNLTNNPRFTTYLYAVWTYHEYTVDFVTNGGSSVPQMKYTYATDTFDLPVSELAGHTMAWYDNDEFAGSACTSITKGSSTDYTFYAKWTANTYTVVFDGNGKTSGVMLSQAFTYDVSAALVSNAFERIGYTFASWNTASDGSGTTYADDAEVENLTSEPNGSVTLYAIWTPIKYTLVFDGNCATSGSMESMTLTYDVCATIPANAFERTGYRFTYWNTAPDNSGICYAGGADVKNLASEPDGTVTFYAQWIANTYTVVFDKNNVSATGTMSPQTYRYDEASALDANEFVLDGKVFLGWSTTLDGDVVYSDEKEVSNLSSVDGATVTLYAVWGDRCITVNIHLDDGLYEGCTVTAVDGDGNELNLTERSAGTYYADSGVENGTYTVYVNGVQISGDVIVDDDAVSKDVYYYTVAFDSTTDHYEQIVLSGKTAVKPADPVRAGYTFVCWKLADNEFDFSTAITETTSLEASWTIVTYSVKYTLNGGTNDPANPSEYTVESGEIVFADAVKTGYVFDGWFNGDVEMTGIAAGSTGDVSVEARFHVGMFNATLRCVDGDGNEIAAPAVTSCEYGSVFSPEVPEITGYTAVSQKASITVSEVEADNIVTYTYSINEYQYTVQYFSDSSRAIDDCFTGKAVYNTEVTVDVPDFAGYRSPATVTITITAEPTDNIATLIYERITYSVTYDLNGGTGDSSNPASYNVETQDIILKAATRDGYVFGGWFSDGTIFTAIAQGSTGDLALTAKWLDKPSVTGDTVVFPQGDSEQSAVIGLDDDVKTQAKYVKTTFVNGGSLTFPIGMVPDTATASMDIVDKSTLPADVREKVGDYPVFSLGASFTVNDTVTITLPYEGTVGSGQAVKAIWIKDDGTFVEYPSVYDADTKTISFQCDHFSNWSLRVYTPSSGDDDNGNSTTLIIAVVVIVVIGVLVLFLWQNGKLESIGLRQSSSPLNAVMGRRK